MRLERGDRDRATERERERDEFHLFVCPAVALSPAKSNEESHIVSVKARYITADV